MRSSTPVGSPEPDGTYWKPPPGCTPNALSPSCSITKRAGEPARFVIEQLGDSEFGVHPGGGFQYVPSGSGDPIVVDESTLPRSDLASVPLALTWFVSRHGRHTPAALVHDRLVRSGSTYDERIRADDIFLEAMERSGGALSLIHISEPKRLKLN